MFHHRKFGFLLAALVVLFLVGADHLAARLTPRPRAPYRIPHPDFHHGLLPDSEGIGHWGPYHPTFYVNDLGMRDARRRSVPLLSLLPRVLFIGDSFTEGMGMRYEQTFPGIIAQALKGELDVLNAGVSSFSPKLYLARVEQLIEKESLRFDELHVFIDISDPQDEILYRDTGPGDYRRNRALKFLLDYSLLGRTLLQGSSRGSGLEVVDGDHLPWDDFYAERSIWTHNRRVFESWGREGLQLAARNMETLHELTSRHGIRLHIAVYPWPEQVRVGRFDSPAVVFWREFAIERGIGFLDLFPSFIVGGGDSQLMIDDAFIAGDVHWNEQGHRQVARAWLKQYCSRHPSRRCSQVLHQAARRASPVPGTRP